MKKEYIECPFCANEIKIGAKKCQYCKEFLNFDNSNNKVKKHITKNADKMADGGSLNTFNHSDGNIFKLILKKFFEVIFIIFGLNDKRITVSRGFLLYFLGVLLSYGIVWLIALPFGIRFSVTDFDSGSNEWCSYLYTIIFILFLRGYILPKRAHDHGRPGYMGLIPIVNIWYFLSRGDRGCNKYGEKPSLLNDLQKCFYKNTFILHPSKGGKNDLKNVPIVEKK